MIGTSVMKELYSFQKKLTFVELLQSYAKLAFKNHVQEGFYSIFFFQWTETHGGWQMIWFFSLSVNFNICWKAKMFSKTSIPRDSSCRLKQSNCLSNPSVGLQFKSPRRALSWLATDLQTLLIQLLKFACHPIE